MNALININEQERRRRCFREAIKRQRRRFHEEQLHKLPNEFRNTFTNYNHRAISGFGYIDENEYDYK